MSVQLTEAQQRAIEAPVDQPSLILAAAGSGKTTVLCYRILHLISQGAVAKDILAVTFSRRAGQDLLHKLHAVAASLAAAVSCVALEGIQVRTFHSFCLTVLRAFPSRAGLSPDFVVLTPKMQLQILEDLIRSWHEEKRTQKDAGKSRATTPLNPRSFAESYGKNTFRAEAYRMLQQLRRFQNAKKLGRSLDNRKVWLNRHDDLFEWVYDKYCMALQSINGIDFSDFPRLAIKVLESCQDALAAIGLQARYILAGAKSNSYKHLIQQKTARQSLRESYRSSSQNNFDRTQNGYIKRLQSFLDHVFLKLHDGELGECDEIPTTTAESQCLGRSASPDSVVLSTIHQAKGLEWMAVILVRANEGVLPLMDCEPAVERVVPQAIDSGSHGYLENTGFGAEMKASNPGCAKVYAQSDEVKNILIDESSKADIMVLRDTCSLNAADKGTNLVLEALEEERRLMYVALTRAKRNLLITHVMLHGQQSMLPSRFLADIPKGLMRRTACYDSVSNQSKNETSQKDCDAKSPQVTISSLQSQHKAPSCKTNLSSNSCSQDKGTLPHTMSRLKRKRGVESRKRSSKDVDVEESLKDIDDLLNGMMEPTMYTKESNSTNGKAKTSSSKNIRRHGRFEVSKGKKSKVYSGCRILESSSDDSDFEIVLTEKCKEPKAGNYST